MHGEVGDSHSPFSALQGTTTIEQKRGKAQGFSDANFTGFTLAQARRRQEAQTVNPLHDVPPESAPGWGHAVGNLPSTAALALHSPFTAQFCSSALGAPAIGWW